MATFLDVAMPLVRAGYAVIPCGPDKKSCVSWKDMTTTDEAQIQEWARTFKQPIAAVLTGNRSGVWVVDVDVPKRDGDEDGRKTLDSWQKVHGSLPTTFTVETPSGGLHLYFRMPKDGDVRNSVKQVAAGIDIRGTGGYVVAPGSMLPDGRLYRTRSNVPPALAPDWLWSLVCRIQRKAQSGQALVSMPAMQSTEDARKWALAGLAAECGKIHSSQEGTRNDTLNTAALKVFQLVAGGSLSEVEAYNALLAAAYACGLPENEARGTIESGRKAGLAEPRAYPGPSGAQAVQSVQAVPTEWPEPVWFDTVELPKLDMSCVPPILGDFCSELAEDTQISVEMPFSTAIAVVSAAGQLRFCVQPRPGGHVENLGLYTLSLLDSGGRKSTVMNICKKPLEIWEREAREICAPILENARLEAEVYQDEKRMLMQKRRNSKDPAEKAQILKEIQDVGSKIKSIPQEPQLIAEDTTSEALAEVLAANHGFIGIFSAEGGLFDTIGGRYSDGVPNCDIYLKGYSGESLRINRKTSPPIYIERCQIAIGMSMQPDLLKNRRAGEVFRSKGLDARFFYFFPKDLSGYRNVRNPKPMNELTKQRFYQKVSSLLPDPREWIEWAPQMTALNFSDDALEAWIDFSEQVEHALRPYGDFYGMKDWGNKLPGGVARLAGVFHILTHDTPERMKISLETVQQAVYVGSVLIDHARLAYDVMGADPELERAKIALDWIQKKNVERFSFRKIQQLLKGRIAFAGSDTLEQALAELESRSFIRAIPRAANPGPGRTPKPDYVVNPATLRGRKQ